jgi:hypothetical protein
MKDELVNPWSFPVLVRLAHADDVSSRARRPTTFWLSRVRGSDPMRPSAQTATMRRQGVLESARSLARILGLLAHRLESLSPAPSSLIAQCLQIAEELRMYVSGQGANEKLLRTMLRGNGVASKAAKRLQRAYRGNLPQRLLGVVVRRPGAADAVELATTFLAQLEKQRQILKTIKPAMLEAPRKIAIPVLL